MLLGLETFSYHLAFAYGEMDIFGFIDRTAQLGLDGVQINAEGRDLAHLGSDDPGFLAEVRAAADAKGLYIEIDANDTSPANMTRMLNICAALGSDTLRVYSSVGGDPVAELKKASTDLKQVVGLAAEAGVRIAFENHEYESADDIMTAVRLVDSPQVGAHIDTGNSMMLWEEPLEAIRTMAPAAVSTHFKDHLVINANGTPMIVGTPLGRGLIDLAECYRIFDEESDLTRINIEVCYGYIAPFRRPQSEGLGAQLGRGCFAVAEPPFDPSVVAPHLLKSLASGLKPQSHAWQELAKSPESEAEKRELLDYQDRAVVESVEFMKGISK